MKSFFYAWVAVVILAAPLPVVAAEHGDGVWSSEFGLQGCDGPVSSIAISDSGDIFVGGEFRTCDGVLVNHVARWDGHAWHALGDGTDAHVEVLLLTDDGYLYAGGWFYEPGVSVARWDGKNWEAVGGGLHRPVDFQFVNSLAVSPQGTVYAGGSFSYTVSARGSVETELNNVAWFDGNEWLPLGSGLDGLVYSIAVDGLGQPVATTSLFSPDDHEFVWRLWRWNDSDWTELSDSMVLTAQSLVRSSTGNVYVSGQFQDEANTSSLAIWSGEKLRLVEGVQGWIQAIAVESEEGFWLLGGLSTPAGNLVHWDGTEWHSVVIEGAGTSRFRALAVDAEGRPLIGGSFDRIGEAAVSGLARFGESDWQGLTSEPVPSMGFFQEVRTLAVDSAGGVYAGGQFQVAGGQRADSIAYWSGNGWNSLGEGLTSDGYSADVAAVVISPTGDVYVGGRFSRSGALSLQSVARWDGSAWHSLGEGLQQPVRALAIDQQNGDLYAATSSWLHRWDGEGWLRLNTVAASGISTLAAHPLDGVYIGGDFASIDGVSASRIALWRGAAWSSVGDGVQGVSPTVTSIATRKDGSLVVGGRFASAGGTPARNVAKWNGTEWSAMGDGLGTGVSVVYEDHQGRLYAAGGFNWDTDSPKRLARWDSSSWQEVGGGVGFRFAEFPVALAASAAGELFVAGSFRRVGAVVSQRFAVFTPDQLFIDGFEVP